MKMVEKSSLITWVTDEQLMAEILVSVMIVSRGLTVFHNIPSINLIEIRPDVNGTLQLIF